MNRKFSIAAALMLATVTFAPSAHADEAGVCVKPWFGVAKNCELGRSINEGRETSKRLAQSNAQRTINRANATRNPVDIERARQAINYSRSFNNEFGSRKK